jgi:hypothetical protein
MSIPRRSARIAHLTAASEKRQTKKNPVTAAAAVATAAPAHDFGAAHIKQMNITSYWRDKLYDDVAVEDWYFTVKITMSDGTKKTSTFWYNNVYMTDSYIAFAHGDQIAMYKGRVCLIQPSPFRETYYIPFAPHITFPMVKGAFLPILKRVNMTATSYKFDFECPAGTYPWNFATPEYSLGF